MRDAILRSQSDPELLVRSFSEKICEKLTQRDYLSEALAFTYFVQGNTRYFRDPRTVELVKSPIIVLKQILAGEKPQVDCDDQGTLVGALGLADRKSVV